MQFMLLATWIVISFAVFLHAGKTALSTELLNHNSGSRILNESIINSARLLHRRGQCFSKLSSAASYKTSSSLPSLSGCESVSAQGGAPESTPKPQIGNEIIAEQGELSVMTSVTRSEGDPSVRRATIKSKQQSSSSRTTLLETKPLRDNKTKSSSKNAWSRSDSIKRPAISQKSRQPLLDAANQEKLVAKKHHKTAEAQVQRARAYYSQLREENRQLMLDYFNNRMINEEEYQVHLSRIAALEHNTQVIGAKSSHLDALILAKEASERAGRSDRSRRNGVKAQTAQKVLKSLRADQELSETRMNVRLASAEQEHLFLWKGRDHPETQAAKNLHASASRMVPKKLSQAMLAGVEARLAYLAQGQDSDSSEEAQPRARLYTWP